jgi:hypothetical protein
MEYDNRGKVSLWKNDRQGETQPVVTGKLVAHRDIKEGETLDIALWKRDDAAGNQPIMTGKIADVYSKESRDDGDDLPF